MGALALVGLVAATPALARAGEGAQGADAGEGADAPPSGGGMNDPGLWNALAGNELQLTLSDGTFRGKLMGLQGNQLVLARAGDGLVVSVPTSEVMRVHAPIERPRDRRPLPVDNGSGLIAGGGVLLGIGIPAVIAGAVMAGVCPECLFIYLPLLIPGGGMVGAGSGMIKVGIDRKRMWTQATYPGRLSEGYGSPLQLRGMSLRF